MIRVTQVALETLVEAPATAAVHVTQVAVETLVESDWPGTLREVAPKPTEALSGTVATYHPPISGSLTEAHRIESEDLVGSSTFAGIVETVPPAQESLTGLCTFSGIVETAPAAVEAFSGLTYAPGPSEPGVTQVLVEVAAHGEQGHAPPALVITQDVMEWMHSPGTPLRATSHSFSVGNEQHENRVPLTP